MAALVEFICVEPDHLKRAAASGALTISERAWAFCPSAEVSDHAWWRLAQPTEIDALRRDWRRFVPPKPEAAVSPAEPPGR